MTVDVSQNLLFYSAPPQHRVISVTFVTDLPSDPGKVTKPL